MVHCPTKGLPDMQPQALLLPVLLLLGGAVCQSSDKPPPAITRTEIRVSKSLNPDDMQTLNVMTKDGNVAQLIVKRRDPKSKPQPVEEQPKKVHFSRAIYTNWFPTASNPYHYHHPNIIRLDTIALVRNSTQETGQNVIDSDRIPNVPKPVTIQSSEIFMQNADKKRARSVLQADTDGIPIIQGVRVPDDESDQKIWRNARVINGELVPYEQGYKPPPVVPIGELIYAKTTPSKDLPSPDSIGPFTKLDNFKEETPSAGPQGPFSVRDNLDKPPEQNHDYVRFNSHEGVGPFTKADNRAPSSKLIDYIKEINAKEAKKDFFNSKRRYRSYEDSSTQMQRRMLQYPGQHSYPNSLLYTPTSKLSPVNFNEGVRTPVLQYAHPELGVQPAKAAPEEAEDAYKEVEVEGGRQSYDNGVDYYRKDVMNYPYNTYYIKPKPEQPFWIRFTESIKDNVQHGFARMQQFTRPVFEPLVEATHKISHNLGLSHSGVNYNAHAQDKVGLMAPAGSVILPALGLVAGGAALGLGAAAVGRFLNPNDMRRLNDDIVVIMEGGKRVRRSVEEEEWRGKLAAPHFWADTPCAKRLFCEVMLRQDADEVVFMEKKMDALMSKIDPGVASEVGHHLEEVMEAVKMRECGKFKCNRRFSTNTAA